MQQNPPRTERQNPYADLIHLLNQRYREQWLRAESLQDELDCLRGSGFWKAIAWMRWLKQRLLPISRSAEPPLAETASSYVEPAQHAAAQGKVSIVIPFRDQAALLRNCLRGIYASSYRQFEVILVDNGSEDAKTLRFLSRIASRKRIRTVSSPGEFNFSRLCNTGASYAEGDYLLFLNNDTEVLSREWLEELVRLARDPRTGAVGGTLLYPDRTIQHAGLFPRVDGHWVHPYRGIPETHPIAEAILGKVRSVPAVTAACLLIRRSLFVELHGFDERYPLDHNDVDLCQRVRQKGLSVLISPHARLFHYEGLSRGIDHVAGFPRTRKRLRHTA